MDIWLRPDNQNKEKLIPVLEEYDILAEDILKLRKADFTKMISFHIDDYPKRVDFLTRVSGLKFDEAFKNKIFLQVGTLQKPMLNLDDLILNKQSSGILKDQADVEALQKILKLRNK